MYGDDDGTLAGLNTTSLEPWACVPTGCVAKVTKGNIAMHHRRHHHPSDDEQNPHKMIEEDETRAHSDVPFQALNDGGSLPVSDDGGGLTRQQIRSEERQDLILHTAASSSSSSSSPSSSSSSSSSDWSLAGDRNDMKLSLISNAVFFLGSSIQTVTGIYDLISLYDDEGGDDDDDTNSATGDDQAVPPINNDDDEASDNEWTRRDYILYIFGIVGAGMYVLNAVADFVQAKASERSGQGRYGGRPKHEIWAAVAFGLAAILETITCVFWTDDRPSPLEANIYVVSMHVYFVSGVLSLMAQGLSCSYSCRNAWSCSCCKSSRAMAKLLMELGGIFFLVGSTVDLVVAYLYDPAVANISPAILAAANLSSSLLWFVDSLFYIAADCIIYSLFRSPMRYVARCVRSNVELPRVVTLGDDNAASKLHV